MWRARGGFGGVGVVGEGQQQPHFVVCNFASFFPGIICIEQAMCLDRIIKKRKKKA